MITTMANRGLKSQSRTIKTIHTKSSMNNLSGQECEDYSEKNPEKNHDNCSEHLSTRKKKDWINFPMSERSRFSRTAQDSEMASINNE
mmetsp:Transcript_42676/g.48364  ORF Transcript_42676/g.48364 Transcript_42676/m.48364 type:complete len:88 (+) Transcript_42676:271-534(+)